MLGRIEQLVHQRARRVARQHQRPTGELALAQVHDKLARRQRGQRLTYARFLVRVVDARRNAQQHEHYV